MSEQDPLAHLCPLCGQSNWCGQLGSAREESESVCQPEACWCMSVNLDEQSRQQLNQQTDGKRCLCQACISKLAEAQRR